MPIDARDQSEESKYCTFEDGQVCETCSIRGSLMCRFERRDLVSFFLLFLPFAVTVVAGLLRAGFWIYLLGWVGYMIFFFFVWEARVLCRHCPYWAGSGSVLRCHANYGVAKIWKHDPAPMSRSERIQFAAGALILLGYPVAFLIVGGEYLFAAVAASVAVANGMTLKRRTCTRCINFSCPMNGVPKRLVDQYLMKNPEMKKAWEENGYNVER